MAELTGGCACGAVRYRLTAPPMFTHCCHCLDCQRQTGSAFVVNMLIEASDVVLDKGAPVAVEVPTDSGHPHDIYRCPVCQTALWSDYGRRGWLLFVRAGTFDDPGQVSPDVHIFTRSKRDWVMLPADVPQFEVYYDSSKLWPPEALQRRERARQGGV